MRSVPSNLVKLRQRLSWEEALAYAMLGFMMGWSVGEWLEARGRNRQMKEVA